MKQIIILPMFFIALMSCTQPDYDVDALNKRIRALDDKRINALNDGERAPQGNDLIRILLENQSVPLKGTGCASGPDDKRVLLDTLAHHFGDGLDSPQLQMVHSSHCQNDQHELPNGSLIDVWNCTLTVNGYDKGQMTEVGWSFHFVLTKDRWKLIPKKFLCMP